MYKSRVKNKLLLLFYIDNNLSLSIKSVKGILFFIMNDTKRKVLAQVLICMGCCCGRTDRGKPEVPVDWLKQEWKKGGLLKSVHLSISGCLGPCDRVNVVCIQMPVEPVWLGDITQKSHYELIVNWARTCQKNDQICPLPAELLSFVFDPYIRQIPTIKQSNKDTIQNCVEAELC